MRCWESLEEACAAYGVPLHQIRNVLWAQETHTRLRLGVRHRSGCAVAASTETARAILAQVKPSARCSFTASPSEVVRPAQYPRLGGGDHVGDGLWKVIASIPS